MLFLPTSSSFFYVFYRDAITWPRPQSLMINHQGGIALQLISELSRFDWKYADSSVVYPEYNNFYAVFRKVIWISHGVNKLSKRWCRDRGDGTISTTNYLLCFLRSFASRFQPSFRNRVQEDEEMVLILTSFGHMLFMGTQHSRYNT